jgi:hypothetical protein
VVVLAPFIPSIWRAAPPSGADSTVRDGSMGSLTVR